MAVTRVSRPLGQPVPGFYELRLMRRAVSVAAEIIHAPPNDPLTGEPLDRSWYWRATVNGEAYCRPEIEPPEIVWRVYLYGEPIDAERYRWLIEDRQWAKLWKPHLPEANPLREIDHRSIPLRDLLGDLAKGR
jgi:hypothetical protein